jgi:hypothetical protein
MPLGGSGGDENGRLTLDARITSCPAWAIFKGSLSGKRLATCQPVRSACTLS